MSLEQNTTDTSQYETDPALSAGLQVGLLGAVLTLVEQLIRLPIDTEGLGLYFCSYRLLVWIGAGALAVYWLKLKGSIEKPKQRQAGVMAGLITGLATAVFMVVFSVIKSEPIDSIELPENISPEFLQQAGVVAMICCYGIPTMLVGMALSYAGSLAMSFFIGSEKPTKQAPKEIPEPQVTYDERVEGHRALMLDGFLARRDLPEELRPALTALDEGDKARSRSILVRFLKEYPRNAQAWLWLATMAEDQIRQKEYVERALDIDPENIDARRILNAIKRASTKRS